MSARTAMTPTCSAVTQALHDPLPTDLTRLEDGTLSITLESTYVADVLPSAKRTIKGVRP